MSDQSRTIDRCSLYGLVVESELCLHQDRVPAPSVEPQVRVRWGDPLESNQQPAPGRTLLHHVPLEPAFCTYALLDDGSYLLRYAGACDFRVDADLRTVTVHLVNGIDPDFAAVLVSGAVLSFLLVMRGDLVLHASALHIGERALAFVGYSGMGKSTMAALVAAHSGRLITDDVLRVNLDGGGARCYLGATELRLRKAASELADRFEESPGRRTTSDARDALRLPSSTAEQLPLGAIVVPRPRRDVDALNVTRLTAMEAMMSLVRYPRLLGWQDQRVQAEQFAHLATLAERVPVYVADVPWGPPFRADIAPRLLEGIGFTSEVATPTG